MVILRHARPSPLADLARELGIAVSTVLNRRRKFRRKHPHASEAEALKYIRGAGWGVGYVYFVRCDVTDLVKVGWSKNPRRRLQQVQRMSPTSLRIVGMAKAMIEAERRLHAALAPHRDHGEWFRLDDALLAHGLSLVGAMAVEGVPARPATALPTTPLRTWRRANAVTYIELSRRTGLSQRTVMRAASGQAVDEATAAAISRETGIDPAVLCRGGT